MEARLVHRGKSGNVALPEKEPLSGKALKFEDDVSSDDSSQTHQKNSVLGIQSLLSFLILFCAWLVGFSSRLFAVVRFESIIHEFDPW